MIEQRRKYIRIAVLTVVLATAAGCGPGRPPEEQSPSKSEAGGPGGAPPPGFDAVKENLVPVTTTPVVLGSINKTLKIGGEVVAKDSVNAFADIAGKVSAVLVDVGMAVHKGQVIARVDPSKPGREYAESPVEAPISGTVTALPVRVGDTISSTTVVATIGRLDALKIETRIPERFVGQVRVGTPARFSFAAWPGQQFPGRIVELSPVVDSISRTMKATLALDGSDSRIKAGMYASAVLITERKDGVIVVPADCVVARDGRTVVFVVDQNRAVERTVSVGISDRSMVEIAGGITAGQEVVESGQSLLSDGVQVRVVGGRQEGDTP